MSPIKQLDLDGMTVCLDPYPSVGLASVVISQGGPAYNERPGQFGYSALLMDYLQVGGGVVTEMELQAQFDRNGNGLEAFCTNSSMGLNFRCRPCDWQRSFDLLARVYSTNFTKETLFAREKKNRLSILRLEKDQFSRYGLRRARQHYFPEDPLSCSPTGREEDLQACNPEIMARFTARALSSTKWIVSVSGAYQEDELLAALRSFRQSIPFDVKPELEDMAFIKRGRGRFEEKVAKEQALFCWLLPAPGIYSGEQGKIFLLLNYFNGLSGPLFEEIREKRGLAYYASASWMPSLHDGCLAFVVGCDESKLDLVRKCLTQEWEKVCEQPLSGDDWQKACVQRASLLQLSRQRTDWRAYFSANQIRKGIEPDLGQSEVLQMEDLSPATLQDHILSCNDPCRFLEYVLRPENPTSTR